MTNPNFDSLFTQKFSLLIILFSLLFPLQGFAALDINNSDGTSIAKLNQPTLVDPNFSLSSDEPITAMQVIIANLSLGDTLDFDQEIATNFSINGSYDSSKGILTFTSDGSATLDSDYQALLRTVTITATQDKGPRYISFTVGEDILFNFYNNHFYKYVEADAISWTEANSIAQNTIYQSMTGYLVTVTEITENQFVTEKINGNSWMGARNIDLGDTNEWQWVSGPEAGQTFWMGLINGTPVDNMFENWDTQEPNNYENRNELYGHFYANGTWNDYPDDAENGFSGNDIAGYVIEFGNELVGEIPQVASTKTVQIGTSNAPIFTNNNSEILVEIAIAEKTTYIETIQVFDEDNDSNELIIQITNDSGNAFEINNGELHLINGLDLKGQASTLLTVEISVSDPENNTNIQTFEVTILLDSDEDLDPNITDPDDDNDGIVDIIENNNGLIDLDNDHDGIINSLDLDSDNDGISDRAENENHLINGKLIDSDGDGIIDTFDADVTLGIDNNNDGIDDNAMAIDTDNDGVADFLDLDSDNDSILDTLEANSVATGGSQAPNANDIDGDGLVNGSPELIENPSDTDNDSIPDYKDLDANGDNIFDISTIAIGILDENNDGMIDGTDDEDADGIIGLADYEPNKHGSSDDVDNDGIPSSIDGDDDNDGIADGQEGNQDTDGDGVVDRLDPDSDGDGISDQIESGSAPLTGNDSDSDGIDDAYDVDFLGIIDINNDGAKDINESSLYPVFSIDSDDDGITDNLEQLQTPPLLKDSDFDGIDDAFDVNITNGIDLNKDGIDDAKVLAFNDFDQDGLLNYLDSDSDNDGWIDGLENGDFNNNNIIDYLEVDPGVNTAVGSFPILFISLITSLIMITRFSTHKFQFLFLGLLLTSTISQAITPYSSCNYSNEYYQRCFYGGGQLGVSLLNPDDSQSTWKAQNSISSAVTAQLGWRFYNRAFSEIEFNYLGANTLKNNNPDITGEAKLHYFTPALYVGGYLYKAEQLKPYNLFIKTGLSAVRNRTNSELITINSTSNFQPSFVLGAELQLQADLFARINLSTFTSDANAITLSIHRFF
ncbi:hypothetical protein [Marinicellulosiphila megalodicopiae]|uniref:hypothetical protein n=1 Tax=Marinicellulosiphila megalodicopiae TaxID=2724896 RepID=UPI003BAE87B1